MKRRSFLTGALSFTSAEMFLKRLSGQGTSPSPAALPIRANSARKSPFDPDMVVVEPVDHGQALLNPDMGWNFPYYIDNQDEQYGGG
ncbi:MAG TPA: hypothetical protein VGG18_17185, partial [Granulicella sp.]